MHRMRPLAAVLLVIAGCGTAAAGTAATEDEAAFRARCREEVLRAQPDAATWVDSQCDVRWQQAGAAAPMAEALLALAPEAGGAAPTREDMRARLSAVRWTSESEGQLGDLAVQLPAAGRISFGWQETGVDGRYNVIEALRIRGVTLRPLGCPDYPGASMGMEKVMAAEPPGHAPFALAVYSRPSPTGFEPAVYAVDADFSGRMPDMAALRAGDYPGGGGRAFAVDPTGWVADCPDPE